MKLSYCGFQYHKFMNLNALFLNETERYPQPQVDIYIYIQSFASPSSFAHFKPSHLILFFYCNFTLLKKYHYTKIIKTNLSFN